ncbi:hypothetical protein CRG98_048735, partial [Punica granatum]
MAAVNAASGASDEADTVSTRSRVQVAAWRSTGWRVASCWKNESDDMAIKAKE